MWQDRRVSCSVTFLLVRKLLGLVGIGPSPDEKDVEIAVLRHQLSVLRRRSRVLGSPPPIAPCSRHSLAFFRASVGPPFSSPRKPCCAGTASSFGGTGRSRARRRSRPTRSIPRPTHSSFA